MCDFVCISVNTKTVSAESNFPFAHQTFEGSSGSKGRSSTWKTTYVSTNRALRSRGEIGKTTDFVRRNIADMQKSFE